MPFAIRAHFVWSLRTRTLDLGPRTIIMGILNVTPDSFSDGDHFFDRDAALKHALQMLDDGADILDLGGESTRPDATPLNPADEQARILPVLQAILTARPTTLISIDTYHAETARTAVEQGAEIVNDVSGHLWDPAMSATCAALRCGTILMHTRGRPQQWRTLPRLQPVDVLPLVLEGLKARAQAAVAAGIAPEAILLDPGFGFGKVLDENYPLLAHLDRLRTLGFPLLVGLSRKSFLARRPAAGSRLTTDPDGPNQNTPYLGAKHSRFTGTGAPQLASERWDRTKLPTSVANAAAILAGAHILRVHDVLPARQTAAIADRILEVS